MGKFSDKFLSAFSLQDDEDDDFDEYDEDYNTDEGDEDGESGRSGFFSKKKASVKEDEPYQAPRRTGTNGQEVCIFKPASIEDSREIAETLLQGKAVVINFEGLHVEIAQRIIDFISGACYALDGNLQKISNYIFIATPPSVDISGDFQEIFDENSSAFDIGGFKSPLL